MVLSAIVVLTALVMGLSKGDTVSSGKIAKQSSNEHNYYNGVTYVASRALNEHPSAWGSITRSYSGQLSWWQVDLLGFYVINSITLTAYGYMATHMSEAIVHVADKDMVLCDIQGWVCGQVNATVTAGDVFTFTCEPPFPVRFVRVTRDNRLSLGHVTVEGEEAPSDATSCKRTYYTTVQDRKITAEIETMWAMSANDCAIKCQQRATCLHFSYTNTAPSGDNCIMGNRPVPGQTVPASEWVLYKLEDCK